MLAPLRSCSYVFWCGCIPRMAKETSVHFAFLWSHAFKGTVRRPHHREHTQTCNACSWSCLAMCTSAIACKAIDSPAASLHCWQTIRRSLAVRRAFPVSPFTMWIDVIACNARHRHVVSPAFWHRLRPSHAVSKALSTSLFDMCAFVNICRAITWPFHSLASLNSVCALCTAVRLSSTWHSDGMLTRSMVTSRLAVYRTVTANLHTHRRPYRTLATLDRYT